MLKSAFLLIITLISLVLPIIPNATAGELTQTSLRLTRQAPSAAAGSLVCVTTPSVDNGTETSLQIIFPTGFTVNQTESNWDVDTNDIPGTSWPGIGTPTGISGQTVTFPSSNLSANTQYCFNFDSISTITTPSSTGSYPATIRTRNGTTTIDSVEVGLSIIANDRVSVTATVPANPSDFIANLTLNNPSNGFFAQNTELSYTLQYQSLLTTPATITVEAEWEMGKIYGSTTPTEDILDYVIGSASNAYSSTPPIIDTVNRKISWNINSFPPNSSQSVTFKLRTNSSYKSTLPVTFSVNGRVFGPGTQTADSTVTSNYYNSEYVTPTPTPTCTPGACPTSPPQAITPTATPAPSQNPIIYAVDIRTISSSNAAVFLAANKNVQTRIRFGTTPNNLNLTASSNDFATQHVIELSNLKPKTRYYFRAVVTDREGKSSGTDIYVFDTAISPFTSKVLTNSIIFTSNDVVLTNYLDLAGKMPNVIVPLNTQYSFRFAMAPFDQIRTIRANLRSNSVLGTSSTDTYKESHSIQITEIKPGQYIGQLLSGVSTGIYKLILRVDDFNGNVVEESVANLYVVNPLKIVDSKSKTGIENTKVNLSYYNFRLRRYEPLSTSLTAITNPSYSDYEGKINIVLPEGKYKADVSVFGFEKKTVEFTIGPNNSNYPSIELKKLPFSLLDYLNYTISTALDAFKTVTDYVDSIKNSARFLELLTFGVILLFIGLSIYQISRVFGVSFFTLPFFIIYHLIFFVHKPKHVFLIQGKVVNTTTNNPVEGVLLHVVAPNGKVYAHTRTNSNGEFAVPVKRATNVKITISKKGFSIFSKILSKEELASKITVAISKSEKPEKFGLSTIAWYFESIAESLFETFLVGTIVLEIIFAQQFGIAKALPCIVISVANVMLWALHARPRKT